MNKPTHPTLTSYIDSVAGPVIRWKPNTLLFSDSMLLPKIYHLRSVKPPHYNQSPSVIKAVVEESDWKKHRNKRKHLDPAVSLPFFFPEVLCLSQSQFSPKSVHDDEPLIDCFVSSWVTALRDKFASSETVFDFSMWGK